MSDTSPIVVDPWEDAYTRFETPAEELRKFQRRLRRLGADQWQTSSRILELFCGRGTSMHALEQLGFTSIRGIDLSPRLLRLYMGRGARVVGDCRALPFGVASCDVVIVQGGLHHLPVFPADLDRVLDEVRRVLTPRGLFVVVEPWQTPFLDLVHALCRRASVRRLWSKFDALATMIELEGETYQQWLRAPDAISSRLEARFEPQVVEKRWGKFLFAGRAR